MKPVLVKITVGGVLAELNGVSELETSFIDRRGGRLKGTTTMKAEEDRALRNALLRRSLVGERKRDEGANNKRGRTLQTIADEGKLRFMLIEDEIMDRSTVGKGIRSRVWLSRSWSMVPTGLPSKTSCLAILGMRMHGLIYARRMVGMNRTNCTFHNWEISEMMKAVDSTYFPPDDILQPRSQRKFYFTPRSLLMLMGTVVGSLRSLLRTLTSSTRKLHSVLHPGSPT